MLQNKFGRRNRRYRTIGMEPLESRAMLSVAAISLRTDGVDTGNVGSTFSQQSADGRYVVFRSSATNLVSGVRDVNGFNSDIFRRDRLTGKTKLVSMNLQGTTTKGAENIIRESDQTDGRLISDNGR